MLKITIQEDDGSKIYFGSGVQMKQLKARGLDWYECTIFVKNSLVKSGSILLHPTDTVMIEETEK